MERRGSRPRGSRALVVPSAERLLWTAALAALPVGCLALYLNDPAERPLAPACPFRTITGLDCPGCGATRALHHVLHGDFGRAADLNLLAVLSLPVLLFGIASVASLAVRGRPLQPRRLPAGVFRLVPVLLAAFAIVRNLPLADVGWMASYR